MGGAGAWGGGGGGGCPQGGPGGGGGGGGLGAGGGRAGGAARPARGGVGVRHGRHSSPIARRIIADRTSSHDTETPRCRLASTTSRASASVSPIVRPMTMARSISTASCTAALLTNAP